MTVKKLRVGIIGFGAVGKIRYEILKKNNLVSVISISDQNIDEILIINEENLHAK